MVKAAVGKRDDCLIYLSVTSIQVQVIIAGGCFLPPQLFSLRSNCLKGLLTLTVSYIVDPEVVVSHVTEEGVGRW